MTSLLTGCGFVRVEAYGDLAGSPYDTKSELVREALRFYIEERRWRKLQREVSVRAQARGIASEEDVDRLVHSARK